MSKDAARFELTITLSTTSKTAEQLDRFVLHLDEALADVIRDYPAITAYFAGPNYEAFEIDLGLRFEGMKSEHITDVADEVLDEAINRASGTAATDPVAVREESSLVPA
jgi:hypothetical protein